MDNRCSVPGPTKPRWQITKLFLTGLAVMNLIGTCSILSQKARSDDLAKCILSVCLDRPRLQAQVSLSMLVFPKGQEPHVSSLSKLVKGGTDFVGPCKQFITFYQVLQSTLHTLVCYLWTLMAKEYVKSLAPQPCECILNHFFHWDWTN